MKLEDIENPMIIARWQEVIEHGITIEDVKADELDEGYLVMELSQEDADTWGIYLVLSISPGGTIAEYMVNQPFHYPTFAALLTAAAARTAAS